LSSKGESSSNSEKLRSLNSISANEILSCDGRMLVGSKEPEGVGRGTWVLRVATQWADSTAGTNPKVGCVVFAEGKLSSCKSNEIIALDKNSDDIFWP
jgi:hypothetical protein